MPASAPKRAADNEGSSSVHPAPPAESRAPANSGGDVVALRPVADRAWDHNERGRGYGLSFVLLLLEQRTSTLLVIPVVLSALIWGLTGSWVAGLTSLIALPLVTVGIALFIVVWSSWQHDAGAVDWSAYLSWKDSAQGKKHQGKKIPMETAYEAYMAGELDFSQDVYDTLLKRNRLFRFAFTMGDLKFYVREFLGQNLNHSVKKDEGDIAHVYNRGNDFYNWFLGETMIYTSGIFRSEDDTLEDAQRRKLDMVCDTVQLEPGDKHLDLGCGWGTLLAHAAQRGSQSTGVTLAKEQAEWARAQAESKGVADRVNVIVDDYRNLPKATYDKITCLEMAEHVGIKNFQQFLLQVRSMLADDGVFYLQIAGLRRPWQYEDLVWGLFMAKYIFPGADASCPLGFVVDHVERAGFEVHRVENCGVHYSLTIKHWYDNWIQNEEAIVAKYGQRWYRMWTMFLAWSAIIAAQGSSTVFMITMTKNHKWDKRSLSTGEESDAPLCRMERWVGDKPVATQQ